LHGCKATIDQGLARQWPTGGSLWEANGLIERGRGWSAFLFAGAVVEAEEGDGGQNENRDRKAKAKDHQKHEHLAGVVSGVSFSTDKAEAGLGPHNESAYVKKYAEYDPGPIRMISLSQHDRKYYQAGGENSTAD
jgi:hypothetical protein